MNWMVRLGNWWEDRRSVPRAEFLRRFNALEGDVASQMTRFCDKESFSSAMIRIEKLDEGQQVPTGVAKEIALIKARQDRLELYVGLKREPQPVPVKGAAQIS